MMESNAETSSGILRPNEKAGVSPGSSVQFERPSFLRLATFRGGSSKVGAFSYFNQGTVVYNANIARYCSIAHNVMIGPVEHPVRWFSTHGFAFNDRGIFGGEEEFEAILSDEVIPSTQRTEIGNDVWIGYGAFVRRGVKIGDGAVIAAQSTVVNDVPPYSIVGGSPARLINHRFDARTITRFLDLQWWKYKLSKNILGPISYSDVEKSLDRIEQAVANNELEELRPSIIKYADKNAVEVDKQH